MAFDFLSLGNLLGITVKITLNLFIEHFEVSGKVSSMCFYLIPSSLFGCFISSS